jgi:CHAD domain-containing protein
MSDRPGLRPQDAVGDTLREVARHVLATARTAIEDHQRVEAVAVHDLRAALKSWRAYLRLIEPFLDRDDRHLRTEARDMARTLSVARDTQAALDAAAEVERHTVSHRMTSRSWDSVRERLEALRESAETASLTPALRKRFIAALDRADARVERWPLEKTSFGDVADNLGDGYRCARELIPEDWRSASAKELHDLRRRVVAHRYQMEVVQPLWPRLGKSWVREAQKLRVRLGNHQDLAVLARLAEPHRPLAPWRSRLQSAIDQQQMQRVDEACVIAARLFAETPKAFRRRLKAMWRRLAVER